MVHQQHIASAFDRDLEAVQERIMKMGGLVEAAMHDAAMALEMRDEAAAEEVRRRDRQIDEMEVQINEAAARVLALRSPTAGDLRAVLTVLKISGNLERIGDFAKNIAKRTSVLVHLAPVDDTVSDLQRMATAVEIMLKDALASYITRDIDLAQGVRMRDSEVDQMYNGLFRQFLTYMMEDPRNVTGCMHLHFIAKNIERMGDHVTSIADQVIYLVTGELPVDVRPKRDRTSFIRAPEEN